MARPSLRRRLVGLLTLVVVAAWVFLGTLTYQDARREIDAVLDAHLEQAATLLAVQADHELFEIGAEGPGSLQPYGTAVVFQVWDASGRLRARSTDAPAVRLSPLDTGFVDSRAGLQRWRVYSRWSAGRSVLVQIAESRDSRDRMARRFVLHALWPLLVALPLLAALMWVAVGRALRPLAELRREVGRRRATDLQPLGMGAVPDEVVPLVQHLNALFERIRGTLTAERRFTSHAAHELRTPIAAIRAQAESAIAAQDLNESRQVLGRVVAACDRLSRLVTQLLTLARVDEEVPLADARDCCLDAVASRVVADLAPGALERGVEIGLSSPGETRIAADPVLVEILIRNLVENAVVHGGRGGRVDVSLERSDAAARLVVADDGPGINPEDIARLGRPFFRAGAEAGTGTGLGLSIVARIAERYHADVSYSPGAGGRGLSVSVSFNR